MDYVLYLPCIWTACAFGFSLSVIGPVFMVIPLMCLLYSILRKTIPPRLLSVHVVLCVLAGVLSFRRVFPTSWQTVFLDDAIPRQLVPIASFFAVAWASKAYFRRRLRSGSVFAGERLFLFLSLIVAPFYMLQAGVRYEGDDTASTVIAAYGSMINNIVIGLFFVTGRLFYGCGWSRVAAAVFILLVAATTHFVQFKMIAGAASLMLLGVPPRRVVLCVVGLLTVLYAVEAYDIPRAIAENPDKGIRVAFIIDAFRSLFDTRFIGIGYGTESVRWIYRFEGMPDFVFMPDPQLVSHERLLELLSRGVHNSFAQAMLRTGLPGLLVLGGAYLAALPPLDLSKSALSHASILFIVIFIAAFVNPALESPVQLVGIGFVYGYLLALRQYAKNFGSIMRSLPRFSGSARPPVLARNHS